MKEIVGSNHFSFKRRQRDDYISNIVYILFLYLAHSGGEVALEIGKIKVYFGPK